MKTVEMNLAKGKKGEIKYCGADVSNEQFVKTSIDTLKNSKDIKDMVKDFEFNGDLKKVKAVGEKFINPAIKTKTLADDFLTDVENTLAKKTAVKAAGK